jgi:hypothetical protein
MAAHCHTGRESAAGCAVLEVDGLNGLNGPAGGPGAGAKGGAMQPMPEDWNRAVAVVAHGQAGTPRASTSATVADDLEDGVASAAFRRLDPEFVRNMAGYTALATDVEYAVGFRRYPMG